MSSLPHDMPADYGAALARLFNAKQLDVEDMKLMILLEMAGASRSTRGSPSSSSLPEAKELLLQNGREETAHAHRLKRAIEKKTGAAFVLPTLAQNPYATPPAFPAVDAALLAGVQQGETAGDVAYQGYADHEPDPEIAEWLRQSGREELRHRDRVGKVIEILARA